MGYEVIKALAKEKGISLESIADYAGLSYNSLSKIIRNTINEPKFTTMKLIAHALDISTDELAVAVGLGSDNKVTDSTSEKLTISTDPDKKIVKKFLKLTERNKYRIEGKIDDYIEEQNEAKEDNDTEFANELA